MRHILISCAGCGTLCSVPKVHEIMHILFAVLVAGFLNIIFIPLIIRLADHKKWFDVVDDRKIHCGNISRLGGIGLFWSFFIAFVAIALIFMQGSGLSPWSASFWPVTVSVIIVHAVGLIDDFRNLRALFKLFVQLAVSGLMVAYGYRFSLVYIPFVAEPVDLGWVGYPLTIIWIVGITNAVNLIDGMDGLCAGISLIASAVFGILFICRGDLLPALIAFSLVGSITGYLFYNFPPASIFMGDAGSTFLGFLLAILPLIGKETAGYGLGIYVAITVTLIPILDTFAAILRRQRKGIPFFHPDKHHLHHKLLNIGFSVRQILALVYGACLFLGIISASSLFVPRPVVAWLMIGSWIIFILLFLVLHYIKEKNITLRKEDGCY